MSRVVPTLLIATLVVAGAVPAATATTAAQQADGYTGTHVSFETADDAVVDYRVGGETVLGSVRVESQGSAETRGDVSVGAGLSAVTNVGGSAVSLDSRTDVRATVTAESGAEITAHDNPRGVLVVRASGESQYVTVNVSSGSEARSEGDRRVVVTREGGPDGAFVVVGDGAVTVNDRGNVSADLGENARLVFRSYESGRDDEDERQERLIADGRAAAEVYVTQSGEDGGELAADVVRYADDTTVDVINYGEGVVEMTAERSRSEGRVVIATVSEQAIGAVDDVQVTVDGEAAAEASSYSELEGALDEGNGSRYLVRQESSARANADVLVAVDHFSTRNVTITSDDTNQATGDNRTESDGTATETPTDGDGSSPDTNTASAGDGPGFGAAVAVLALSLVSLAAARRAD